MILLPTYEERFEYLKLGSTIADLTFGGRRQLNQALYRCREWKNVRRDVIIRDNGCDLADSDRPIYEKLVIHHINPITIEDILRRNPKVLDLDNLVCTSFLTHNAIHYGSSDTILTVPKERTKNDTCPWKN